MDETKTHGNQSDVARRLGISRQAVAKLIKNRERTGIPEPGKDGLFDLEAVAKWYLGTSSRSPVLREESAQSRTVIETAITTKKEGEQ